MNLVYGQWEQALFSHERGDDLRRRPGKFPFPESHLDAQFPGCRRRHDKISSFPFSRIARASRPRRSSGVIAPEPWGATMIQQVLHFRFRRGFPDQFWAACRQLEMRQQVVRQGAQRIEVVGHPDLAAREPQGPDFLLLRFDAIKARHRTPARAMITSSPLATRCRRREKWVFAS